MDQKIVDKNLSLERYRALMEDAPICTVDVIFLNPDKTKILLGKRVNEPFAGVFYSFGGRLYKNEEFLHAACRIAKQEVGISIAPAELTFGGVLNEINDSSIFEGVNYHDVDIYFVCAIEEQPVVLDAQHSEAQWFDVNDPTLDPTVRARIQGALRAL
jgi:colanic acid biosynthesis protein WcaH